MMNFLRLLILLALFGVTPANAQSYGALTKNNSAKIATGNTFQQLLPLLAAPATRRSLTIQNNQISPSTDVCYIAIGGPIAVGDTLSSSYTINGATLTAAQAAIPLTVGQPYIRYYPYVPSDQILGTCTGTGDSIYVDVQ